MYVSDGGHVENLSMLALVARRLQTIVAVCATPDGWDPTTDLQTAIEQSRSKFGASFTSIKEDQLRRKVNYDGQGKEIPEAEFKKLDLAQDIAHFAQDNNHRCLV